MGNNKPETNDAYQDDDVQQVPINIVNDDFQLSLVDTTGVPEDVPISLLNQINLEEEEEEDIELISDSEEEEEFLDQDIEEEERLEQEEEDDEEVDEETDRN